MAFNIKDDEADDIVAEINITPLTDIFLVLLIIFMISSSAMLESGLQVKLPTAKSSSVNKSQNGKPTYITIARDGQISVNQSPTTEANLSEMIKQALKDNLDHTVVIRGDESIDLGKAVKIMDAARTAGAEKIAVATQSGN